VGCNGQHEICHQGNISYVCVCVCGGGGGRDIRFKHLHQYDTIWEDFSPLLFVMLPVTSL
jgi:hypothetical protein